jgi:hypothetical protein
VLILSQRCNGILRLILNWESWLFRKLKEFADDLALLPAKNKTSFYTKDFVGCGFFYWQNYTLYQWVLMDGYLWERNLCVAFEGSGYWLYYIFAHIL